MASLVLLAVLAVPSPSSAHPSGQLPTARLDAEGRTVSVAWSADADDAADIGVGLGLLEEEAVLAFLGDETAEEPTDAEIDALSASPALAAYLLDNVEVHQHGRPCGGRVLPIDDFLTDGAVLVFSCPAVVDEAEIRITLLHDRDPAYATYSLDGSAQFAVHTSAAPAHPWDFTQAPRGPDRTDLLLLGGVLGAAGVAGVVLRRSGGPPRTRPPRTGRLGVRPSASR